MSLLSGILQSQAPAKQDATTAIQTLCLRLTTSCLVEDRRAAILSLRSFAREYKETVASGGLRGLIQTLAKDYEDVDTAKVVLETLLLLFAKDKTNPESSDDIALWLADEFTQKQENLTILIDLLESPDFYTRLYTLQLLAAILENRPERAQECVYTAPLGVSRLASILDDKRDAIRNEAILLLVRLSDGHQDVQKIIAFENAFDRIFSIIDAEGGVDDGIIVQDCLQLLTNLLAYNASNQVLFRETGFVPKLYKLFNVEGEIPPYAIEKRNNNLHMTLWVCRACIAPGGQGTPANQHAFFHSGILAQVLDLAFSNTSDFGVRAEALRTCADIIHGNAPLQEHFAQLQVKYVNPALPLVDTQGQQNGDNKVYVIEGLLDQALLNSAVQAFDVRIAACSCLESYFSANAPIRLHFLRRAIDGYTSGEDETANILACLMDLDSGSRNDPYKIWVAAVIFLHIIYDNDEAKVMATSVAFGNEEEGEEVVTAIQTIAANLITCLEHNYDPRISLAYLMVLCTWLYEDTVAVDDFLQEGAIVQSLVAAVTKSTNSNSLVQGLCTFLLGILYEFSTTDSPVPRATLHTILVSRLGRDQYVNKLTRLRENSIVRDFEVTVQTHNGKRGLPDIFFNHIFIDFLKDNYSRIFRTINKDPGQKTHYKLGSDGTPNGISLELVDSLKAQIVDKEDSLGKLQTTNMDLEKKVAQEQQDFKKFKEASAAEIRKYHDQAEALKRHYEANSVQTEEHFKATVLRLENRVARARKDAEEGIRRQKSQGDLEVKKMKDAWEADSRRLRQEMEAELRKMDEGYRREMERIKSEGDALVQRITTEGLHNEELMAAKKSSDENAEANKKARKMLEQKLSATEAEADVKLKELEEKLKQAEQERKAVEEELKVTQDKVNAEEEKLKVALTEAESKAAEVKKSADEEIRKVQEDAEERLKEEKAAMGEKLTKAQEDAQMKISAAEERANNVQTELDDLLLVLGDIEDKKKAYKVSDNIIPIFPNSVALLMWTDIHTIETIEIFKRDGVG
ncbi:p115 like vesicle tethering protein [Terfezia claveryi]|nr:p115 like vesicle tethering protein [Terfezia claveryi]